MIYLLQTDDVNEDIFNTLLNTVPHERYERTMKYRFYEDRLCSVLSYKLLSHALEQVYGIKEPLQFSTSQNGKPTLKTYSHIHFNISHCKKAVCCMISDCECGVDVECIRNLSEKILERVFTVSEKETILGAENNNLEFSKLWSAKEAAVKKLGHGVEQMKNVDISEIKQIVYDDFILSYSGDFCEIIKLNAENLI